MKDFYERYWTDKLPKMKLFGNPPKQEDSKRNFELCKIWLKGKILDYGCGEGHLVNIVNNWPIFIKATECFGVDISERAVERARKLYPKDRFFPLNSHFSIQFDAVTCFDVMEHIFDFDELFTYIKYHLKPKGLFIIGTNEMCFLKMVAIGLFYMDTFFHPYSPHIRFFTRKTLTDLLESKGFEVIYYERIGNHFGLSVGQFMVAKLK